jgi:hypothetical protein
MSGWDIPDISDIPDSLATDGDDPDRLGRRPVAKPPLFL